MNVYTAAENNESTKVQTLPEINEHAIYTHTQCTLKQRDITEYSARTGICLIC